MSYCTTCGAVLAPDARFCTSCGTAAGARTGPTMPETLTPQDWAPPPAPPPKKQSRAGMIILCVFAGLIGLGVVAAVLGSLRGGEAEPEATDAGQQADAARPEERADPAGVRCNDTTPPENPNRPSFNEPPPMSIDRAKRYTATMETSCGTLTIDLDRNAAPKTVNSFVFLAKQKYFDGLTFHRVVKDFVIQGGDPTGTGSGGPGYEFEDELSQDGYQIGSLAMANAGPDTNGSQFFIVTGNDGTQLPSKYSRFGIVTSGIEVAQKLESFAQDPPDAQGRPSRTLYIFSITIQEG